ncbi:hypothetical protein N824_01940 [Pedobacter sp. V48]|nr:hypothetical protein N824_01940 [Pedobacter sp. V48]
MIFLTLSVAGYAQNVKTGIGSRDPQQNLHVSGATGTPTNVGTTGIKLVKPTVRIDGLNSANNVASPAGTDSLKRIYANQNGDLVLVDRKLEQPVFAQQFGDVIPTQTKTLIGFGTVGEEPLKTLTFKLMQPSVVYFSASFAAVVSTASIIAPTDRRAKLFGAYFRFSSAPTNVSTTANFGTNKKTYTNGTTGIAGLPLGSPSTGIPGVKGTFILNPRARLVLPAGDYTLVLYGEVTSNTNILSVLPSVEFGGGTEGENFIVSATPIQY